MNLTKIAHAYGINLIDYEREGDGILITTGAGLMMATMDAIPRLRWCADLSGGRSTDGLQSLLTWADRQCTLMMFHGWFSISSPDQFIESFRPFAEKTIWRANCSTNVRWAKKVDTFSGLITAADLFDPSIQSPCTGQDQGTPLQGSVQEI